MYKLFLDIGNSYVKWSTVIDGEYSNNEPLVLSDIVENGLTEFNLQDIPDEVFFSSVADANLVDQLKSLIQSEWQILPIQLTSQHTCCGLQTGYKDFTALGDDRWFAMLGAIELYQQPFIVIDAGTALTIDTVIDGSHQGGFIVPGLYTMRASLSVSTADLLDCNTAVSDEEQTASNDLLAGDTASAILGGTLYMAAAFINRVIQDLNQQLDLNFKVLITGGDADQITPLLDYEYDYIPDLVLHGMVYLEESVKKQ